MKKLILIAVGAVIAVAVFLGVNSPEPLHAQTVGPGNRVDMKTINFTNLPSVINAGGTSNLNSMRSFPAGSAANTISLTAFYGSTNASPVSGTVVWNFNTSADGVVFTTDNRIKLTTSINGTNAVCMATNLSLTQYGGHGWIKLTSIVSTGTNTIWPTNVTISYLVP